MKYLEKPSDVKDDEQHGYNTLHWNAIRGNHEDRKNLEKMMCKPVGRFVIDKQDRWTITVKMEINTTTSLVKTEAIQGHFKTVDFLLKNGLNVDGNDSVTPLY